MESLLLVLKLLGVVSTAVFGIIGTMHDFRTQGGKLTKWGKASIAGTIVSVFVTVSAQFVETYLQGISARKAAFQALESTQRLERIIGELNRTMQPIESVSAYIKMTAPMDDQLLQSYKQRLDNGIKEFLRLTPSERRHDQWQGIFISSFKHTNGGPFPGPGPIKMSDFGVPQTVEISSANPLFPDVGQEWLVRAVLDVRYIDLAFYRVPIPPSDFRPATRGSNDPDLRVTCFDMESLHIQKDLESQTFYLVGELQSDRAKWENKSGKIVAIPDLTASQLFISFGLRGSAQSEQLRRSFSLDYINLTFANRNKQINSSKLKKHLTADGLVFWEFIFPTSDADLFAND